MVRLNTIRGPNADAVWRAALSEIARSGIVQAGRDQPTKEILNVNMQIDDARQRLVYSLPINPAFGIAEVLWILAGRDDLEFLAAWNPRMKRWSDDGTRLHGAYGKRLRAHFGIDQLLAATDALAHEPESRQVVLQMWDAREDLPTIGPRSRDVPCNIASHLLVRRKRLEWTEFMRSNDLVWGTPQNFIQFSTLQEIMAGWMGLEVGSYNHYATTMHVYQRHWDLLKNAATLPAQPIPPNRHDLRLDHNDWKGCWRILVEAAEAMAAAQEPSHFEKALGLATSLTPAYQDWVRVLAAEAARRKGFTAKAETFIAEADDHWAYSWRFWSASRELARAQNAPKDAVVLPPMMPQEPPPTVGTRTKDLQRHKGVA